MADVHSTERSGEGVRAPTPSLFARMEDGRWAENQAEGAIEKILGVDLLGISFDSYDGSFEIYPMEDSDLNPTPEQHAQIMALGCLRYWINFPNGTEIYSGGPRKKATTERWHSFNRGVEGRRAADSESKSEAAAQNVAGALGQMEQK